MYTYVMKQGRFANDLHFARCANQNEQQILISHGWERISRKDAARLIAWVNAENSAWGSGNAFGFQRATDLFSGEPEYTASVIIAQINECNHLDAEETARPPVK